MIELSYMGLDLLFHPRLTGNIIYHFCMKQKPEMGFYDKDCYEVWGKPNKKNYLEILDTYIKSSPIREKTIISNAEFFKNENT